MCGIAGLVFPRSASGENAVLTRAMCEAIAHRGPDADGVWTDDDCGVALGHRRLSILDLTPEGAQPMASAGGRYQMVFNGEVYNFAELRSELEPRGHRFRGHSDTEVMLAAIEEWGVEQATKRFNGMFAFALWDRQQRRLTLARDRLGVKPVYYGWGRRGLLFGSELKAIERVAREDLTVSRGAIAAMLRYNNVPAPWSIYSEIFKLPQGTLLTLEVDQCQTRPSNFSADMYAPEGLRPQQYWSAAEAVARGMAAPFRGSADQALDELDRLIRDSVKLRMVADVPLGAFLSGGIDSSLVVALMQAQSSRPVRSFSIGFHESGYNEAQYAAEVAKHLGTDHTELYVTPEEAQQVIPDIPKYFDEPFADMSQIPTYLLAKLTRKHVTVSLSGDGGDELFGGYVKYQWAERLRRVIESVPRAARFPAARLLSSVARERWDALFAAIAPVLPRRLRVSLPGDKMHKLARVLATPDTEALFKQMSSHWPDPAQVVIGADEVEVPAVRAERVPSGLTRVQQLMYRDLMHYLPDDVMVKVDRATMAVSLEAREPLLDYRLAEFAWSLPQEFKIRGGETKWILKQLLFRYVPRELVERPKMGFGVPLDTWLRGPLKEWAGDMLQDESLRRGGYLRPEEIRRKWEQHLRGAHNWQYLLWDVLMFQAWEQSRRSAA